MSANRAQESDPLLRGQQNRSRDANNRAADDLIDGSATDDENDEMAGTWGMKEHRSRPRRTVDTIGLVCVLTGLAMFLPIVQYVVLDTHANTKGGLGWFTWHPTMQSLGITVAVLSIQSLQTTTSPPGSIEKKRAFNQHKGLLLGLGIPAFVIGITAMLINKSSHGAKHFTSWHGKLGLAVSILLVIQALVGGLSHYYSSSMGPRATRFYKYHRMSGYVLLPLVLVVAHLGGAWSDWFVGHSSLALRIAAFDVGLGLVAVGLVMRLRPSKMKFF